MKNALREFLDFKESNPQITNNQTLIDDFFAQSDLIDTPTWCKEDIRSHAEQIEEEITDEQVDQVADLLANKTDANVGVNWEAIASRIWEVKYD